MVNAIAMEAIETYRQEFMDLADKIWNQPEVAYQEHCAAQWTAQLLEQHGFQVERGAYGIPTALRASWGSGRPVIGFLGEYDALAHLSQTVSAQRDPIPGQMYGHACGHNILGVGHLAAAVAMKEEMEARKLEGIVIFYGCPAEEVGTGKGLMAKNGAFQELDAAMAYHPSWFNYIFTGGKKGVHSVQVDFFGKSSHSGSSPHNGRSALLAAEMANLAATMIQRQLPPDCSLSGAVAEAFSPGQIPEHCTDRFNVAAGTLRDLELVHQRLENLVAGVAQITETTYQIQRMGGCCPLLNNRVLANVAYEAMTAAPREPWSQEEIEFARKLNATTPGPYQMKLKEARDAGITVEDMQIFDGVLPIRTFDTNGSTDVGDVSHIVPTIFFKVCCYNMGTNGHTWQATACAGSSIGVKGMLFAARVLAMAGLKVMEHPELLEAAKEEFLAQTKDQPYISSLPDDYHPF